MTVIQLDLFSDVSIANYGFVSTVSEGVITSDFGSPSAAALANPCQGCEFHGLCSDTCAMSSSLLDPIAPTRFRNLNDYISLLKHNGWL